MNRRSKLTLGGLLALGLGLAASSLPAQVRLRPAQPARKLNTTALTMTAKSRAVTAAAPTGATGAAPSTLSPATRLEAARHLARLASSALGKATPDMDHAPPASVTLTAAHPLHGENYLAVFRGGSRPLDGYVYATYDDGSGFNLRYRPLVVNSAYMLDCRVDATPKRGKSSVNGAWQLDGAVQASIQPQSGHLIAGFIANTTDALVLIGPPKDASVARIYACELTRLP